MSARAVHGPAAAMTLVALSFALGAAPTAQQGRGAGPGVGPANARAGALIDLTGQWVAVVTEDWRWRMVTPPKGDTASVPLNPAGRKVADAWDLAADRAQGNLCKAFGPPGGIRQPGRLRVRWENDNLLLLELDAGTQTRRLQFGSPPPGARTLQGHSVARWARQQQNRGIFGGGGAARGGTLEVVTTNLTSGYLRPNGVPYSERAVVKEFFDTFTLPDNDGTWLIVTTVVNDPEYLTQEFVISTQFKKESDGSKWTPRPCDIPAPPAPRRK